MIDAALDLLKLEISPKDSTSVIKGLYEKASKKSARMALLQTAG